jgi:hypothetical protein
MVQSYSSETSSFPASQQVFCRYGTRMFIIVLKQPAIGLYSEPDKCSHIITHYLLNIYFNIILQSMLATLKYYLPPSVLCTFHIYAMRATWPADFIIFLLKHTNNIVSWDSSVTMVSGYGLDEIRSPTEAKNFSSSLCVQTDSGADPAFCIMGRGGRGRGLTLTTHPI